MKISASSLLFGVGITVGVLFAASLFGEATGCPASPIAVLLAVIALVIVTERKRDAVVVSITVACTLGATLAVGASSALWMPLAHSFYKSFELENVPFRCAFVIVIGAAAAVPIILVVRRAPVIALSLAGLLAICTTVLLVLDMRSLARPSPDDLARVSVEIEPGGHANVGGVALEYDDSPPPAEKNLRCVVHANGRPFEIASFYSCPTLVAHADEKSSLLVLYGAHAKPVLALTLRDSATELSVDAYRARLGAPRAWIVGAFVSLLIACAAITAALQKRAQKIEGVEGHHEHDGWIRIDGVPRFCAELVGATPGALVVVLENVRESSSTYRDDGAATVSSAKLGTLASLRAYRDLAVTSWACVAIASLCAGSAPLLIAHLNGLG